MTRGASWTEHDYVVVDVEGNGARPPELVELAVVPIREGRIGRARTWLVRPSTPITERARRVHRIADADVAGAPVIADVETEVRTALGDAIVVGHAVHVDVGVLRRTLPGWEPRGMLDTLRFARCSMDLPSYTLGALVTHSGLDAGLPASMHAHRAGYDAVVTARLFLHLASGCRSGGATLAELERVAGSRSGHEARATARGSGTPLFDLP